MAQILRTKIIKPSNEKVDEFETSIAQVLNFIKKIQFPTGNWHIILLH